MTTIDAVHIGERLRKQRTRRLMSQTELAKAAGMTRNQIGRIERDEVEPRLSSIRKLAKALQVEPDKLIGEDFE